MTELFPAVPAATSTTPRQVWIVGALALLWNAIGAYDYLMTQTHDPQYMAKFSAEQLHYFYAFPKWVVGAWAVAVWGGVLGSVLLLLRKKLAVWVFLVSFVCMVVTTVYNYALSNGAEVMGGVGPALFTAIIFAVALALWLYSRKLVERGILS
jgi:hypothetical protein